jgi:hypothetical protein
LINVDFNKSKILFWLLSDQIADSPLVKQPIADADAKLTLFRDVSGISSNGFENYIKSIVRRLKYGERETFNFGSF